MDQIDQHLINWFKQQSQYTYSRLQVIVHCIFWLFMTLFVFNQYKISLNNTQALEAAYYLTGSSISLAMIGFYWLSRWSFPKFYLSQFTPLVISVIVIYGINLFVNRITIGFVANNFEIFKRASGELNKFGFWTSLFRPSLVILNWDFSLSILSMPVIIKTVKDIAEVKNRSAQFERDKLKFELDFLRAQIQPHFIFNVLNSIYSLAADKDNEIAEQVLRLSVLLRYIVRDAHKDLVTLEQESIFLRGYINIEASRHNEKKTIHYTQEGPLSLFYIQPMLLITYIENAFKHGINAAVDPAWAIIKLQVNEAGLLQFEVKNSKPKLKINKIEKGMGMQNTQRRLDILFPDSYSINVTDTNEEFIVILTLKLKRLEQFKNKPHGTDVQMLNY